MQVGERAAKVDRNAADQVQTEGSDSFRRDGEHRGLHDGGQTVRRARDLSLSDRRPRRGAQRTDDQRHQLPERPRQAGELERLSAEVRFRDATETRLGSMRVTDMTSHQRTRKACHNCLTPINLVHHSLYRKL